LSHIKTDTAGGSNRYSWLQTLFTPHFSQVWVFRFALFFFCFDWLDFKKKLKAEVKAERSFQFPDR